MDSLLKKFSGEIIFRYDKRIVDLFCLHNIEYTVRVSFDGNAIFCQTKSLVMAIFLNGNVEVFSELSNVVREMGYIYFNKSEHSYYEYLSPLIFCFGNLEMIKFLQSKINLSRISPHSLKYLAYRFDDNVEIVDTVLKNLDNDHNFLYTDMAFNSMCVNNINIFKYVYNNSQMESFCSENNRLIWSNSNIEFLEFFLSKSAMSEKDIIDGIKIADNVDKLHLVLSYVESGRLSLKCKTIKWLNEAMVKNGH
jgi:hypothetical protein